MTETTTEVAAEAPAAASPVKTQKKAKAAKGDAKKPKKAATHPPANEMVLAAIKTLKERKGSSLQAIKKYIAANYKCDVAKLSIFIRKALVNGVEKGTLVQTKGSGASGSFKLKADEKKPKKAAGEKKAKKATSEKKKVAKKPANKKPTGEKKAKKPAAKKPASEKKVKAAGANAAKKAGTVKKAADVKPKPAKAAAKKPKKAAPAKKSVPKKAAAKK